MFRMNVTPKDLLDAGVHFGHQTKRWNPRFKQFLFDHRQGISVIDLTKTHACLEKACQFLENTVAEGGDVLLIGTKRQAQEIVREAAAATNMPFCTNRWMGGTLTNFETIKRSITKYKRYQEMETSGELAKMHKKEASAIKREMTRMHRNFEGLAGLTQLPTAMLVIDTNYEDIAVAEGKRCNLPVVALVDTNSDPGKVTYPIPGNDDAVKSIRIILDALVEAIQSGLSQRDSRRISRGQQQLSETNRMVAPAAQQQVQVLPATAAVIAAEPDLEVDPKLIGLVPDEEILPVVPGATKRPARPTKRAPKADGTPDDTPEDDAAV
jgi:small subunit ribosomal protein S2